MTGYWSLIISQTGNWILSVLRCLISVFWPVAVSCTCYRCFSHLSPNHVLSYAGSQSIVCYVKSQPFFQQGETAAARPGDSFWGDVAILRLPP